MMPYRCFADDESYILYFGLVRYPRGVSASEVHFRSNRHVGMAEAGDMLNDFHERGFVERVLEGRGGSKRYVISPSIPPTAIKVNVPEIGKRIRTVLKGVNLDKLYDWKFIHMVQSSMTMGLVKSLEGIDLLEKVRNYEIPMEITLEELSELIGSEPPLFGFGRNVNDVLNDIERIARVHDDIYTRSEFTGNWRRNAFNIIKLLGTASVIQYRNGLVSLLFTMDPVFTTRTYFKVY